MQRLSYEDLSKFKFKQKVYGYNEEALIGIIKNNDIELKKFLTQTITKNQFVAKIKSNSKLLKEHSIGIINDDNILSEWISNIINLAEDVFLGEQLLYLTKNNKKKSNNTFINNHLNSLNENGLTEIIFDEIDLKKIKLFSNQFKPQQYSINRLYPSKFNLFFNKLIFKYKIERIASLYSKVKMMSHPNYTIRYVENYFKKNYASIEQTVNHSLNDLHLDRYAPSLTFAIYLSDVSKSDGPFHFIEGSNNHDYSQFLRSIQVAVTYALIPEKESYFDSELEDDRKIFMQIPRIFRKHLVVGTYLQENSNLFNYYKKKLKYITGSTGSAILFDGYKTLHTGGRPEKGKRLSLFNALTPIYKLFRKN